MADAINSDENKPEPDGVEKVAKGLEVPKDELEKLIPEDDGAKFTQAQLNALLAKERRDTEAKFSGFEELTQKAARLDQIEAEKLTAEEKRSKADKAKDSEIETLKAAIAARDLADLRREVADAAGLPAKLAARLTGSTKEELEADAAELKGLLPQPKSPKEGAPAEKLTPGGGGTPKKFDADRVANSIPRTTF